MIAIKKVFDCLLQWTVEIAEIRSKVSKQNVWY